MNQIDYVGTELDLFANALNWKSYWSSLVTPFVRGRVLDVGAGIGATMQTLAPRVTAEWTAIEPDACLADRIRALIACAELPGSARVITGTLDDIAAHERFDTILYIDVLEHIEDDQGELARAVARLAPGGHLIVLAPAHQWLYSPFDRAIGHFRRYGRAQLQSLAPPQLKVKHLRYLDSAGLIASLANKWMLRTSAPTPAQIAVWDRLLVPVSTKLDRVMRWHVGKSLLLVCSMDEDPR